jgi:hypothetical protein
MMPAKVFVDRLVKTSATAEIFRPSRQPHPDADDQRGLCLYEGVGGVLSIDTSLNSVRTTQWATGLADFIGLDTCLAIMVLHGLADTNIAPARC